MTPDEEADWIEDDWIADCLRWRGRVLTGERRHWCPEWHYLPVDETTEEFVKCRCRSISAVGGISLSSIVRMADRP
jgi:hypothetical protein